jgi:hypothetical protein
MADFSPVGSNHYSQLTSIPANRELPVIVTTSTDQLKRKPSHKTEYVEENYSHEDHQ